MHNVIMSAISATNSVTLPTSRASALHKKLMQVLPLPGVYWSVYTANNRSFYAYIGCHNDIWQTDDRVYDGNHHHTLVWAVEVWLNIIISDILLLFGKEVLICFELFSQKSFIYSYINVMLYGLVLNAGTFNFNFNPKA
jgi:hypothetical protein